MKISVANLKNLDYKQLAINHGEKFVVSLIGLFVVITLVGTRWSSYEKTPRELATTAEESQQKVLDEESNSWPQDEQQQYIENVRPVPKQLGGESYRVTPEVAELVSPIEVARYDYAVPMSWPLNPKDEPIQEPDWLPVRHLIADASRVLLEVNPPSEETDAVEDLAQSEPEEQAAEETDVSEEEIPARFRKRDGRTGGTSSGGYGGPFASGGAAGGYGGGGGYSGGYPGGAFPAGEDIGTTYMEYDDYAGGGAGGYGGEGEYAGEAGGYAAGSGEYGMAGAGSPYGRTGVHARGVRYVAVRGVFPWKEQLEELADALNYSVTPNVNNRNALPFLEFELQRQSAEPGSGHWSNRDEDWEPVDREVALDVLREVTAFDPDIVNAGVIEQVFTMPLPRRVVGRWADHATHPDIKNFTLSPEEIQREVEINRKLLEEASKRLGGRERLRKGGFADLQYDIGGLRSQLMPQLMSGQSSSFASELAQQSQKDGGIDAKAIEERIRRQANAAGHLLLFRYFDFDVEPGRAYRYRVRLVVTNPNYKRPVEEVVTPDVVKGAKRKTPWSQPTKPTIVPPDVRYFLTDVAPARGPKEARASFDVFQWLPDAGTVVNAIVTPEVGQFIGGTTLAEVLRPAKETFEKEKVELAADDVLVDLVTPPKIDASQHPDLELKKNALDLRNRITITDRALVADEYGRLLSVDPYSKQRQKKRAEQLLTWERTPFQYIKERAEQVAEGSPLDQMAGDYGEQYQQMMMGSGPMMGPGGGSRRANPIRRGASSRRGMSGSSRGGMPGTGAPY